MSASSPLDALKSHKFRSIAKTSGSVREGLKSPMYKITLDGHDQLVDVNGGFCLEILDMTDMILKYWFSSKREK